MKKTGGSARAPLSRERVLRAGVALADVDGIESLSMRKLGQALGVQAMSLYRYVSGRDDVLDGIVDLVVAEIELPGPGAPWREAMRQRAISAHEVVLRHPWASSLIESRKNLSPERLRYADTILGSLRQGGFPIAVAGRAFFLLDSYVYGFTLQEVNQGVPAQELPQVVARLRPQVPTEVYTNLAEFMEHLARRNPRSSRSRRKHQSSYAADFEFGLDLILDGLQSLLTARGQRAR